MTHVRTSIRDEVVTAITGLATTGTNVYSGRVFPMDQAKLPCWLVYMSNEDVERASVNGLQDRNAELVLEGVARAVTDIDDTLDTMIEEVEEVMDISSSNFKAIDLSEIEIDYNDDGDVPFGRVIITYVVNYHTNEGAPAVAL